MGWFIVKRLGWMLLTLWVVYSVSFFLMRSVPGSPLSAERKVSPEIEQNLKRRYRLDQPLYMQYLLWIRDIVFKGYLGRSMQYGRPVGEVIGDRLALTMAISVLTLIFTWVVSIPIGIYSAVKRYSLGDYIFTFIGFIGLAVPGFMLALIVLYVGFRYFDANVGGLFSPELADAPWNWIKVKDMINHLPIPAVVLGLSGTAQMIRIMRSNLLDELRKPYVMTARARGLSEMRVIMKYPVRVALNPFISTIGYLLPYIVSGSIIISLVLSLPTVGPLLLKALVAQDMFLAGTIVLMLGVLTVIGTFISDLLLMWVDPRIRLERR